MTRRCQNCYKWKPLTEYYRRLTGYQYICKACNAEVKRYYQRRKRHPFKQASRPGDHT